MMAREFHPVLDNAGYKVYEKNIGPPMNADERR
jgi:hypothetical protein